MPISPGDPAHSKDQVPQGSPGARPSCDAGGAARVCKAPRHDVSGAGHSSFFHQLTRDSAVAGRPQHRLQRGTSLAGLDQGGKRVRPHDLRHRFAVKRLTIWHQQRADVRGCCRCLRPISAMAVTVNANYVTADADLLAMAAERALAGKIVMSSSPSFRRCWNPFSAIAWSSSAMPRRQRSPATEMPCAY